MTGLLVGLPLIGALLSDNPIDQYLEFPPLTRYIVHQPFSKFAFILFFVITATPVAGLAYLIKLSKSASSTINNIARFPWWGWLAGITLAIVWFLAWTRYAWFGSLQAYTFTPLWAAFIVLINAVTYTNRGQCLLTHQPKLLLWLFPASSLFWWYFEYLNRFIQNWYYLGIETFSPTTYVIHASFAFSTVLPAVASVNEYLASLGFFGNDSYKPVAKVGQSKSGAIVVLVAGSLGLMGIAIWPEYLFPLVWITPLMLFVALQILGNDPNLLSGFLKHRDWRLLTLPPIAALACGLLWELWNYYSYAKWQYSIPFVQILKFFEMPILGYAGYILFGFECIVVTEWLRYLLDETRIKGKINVG